MKVISIAALKEKGACESQVELAERTFGSVIKLNKTNFYKAIKIGLDVHFCTCFLTGPALLAALLKQATP